MVMRLASRTSLSSILCFVCFLLASDFIVECKPKSCTSPRIESCNGLIAGTYIPNIPCFRSKLGSVQCHHPPNDNDELRKDLNVNISVLQQAIKQDTATIIDVRTDLEVKDGIICAKKWMNIPHDEIGTAFKLEKKHFEAKYGCQKPDKGDQIIFHCKSGKRSKIALLTALELGFNKVQNYAGGWLDWVDHINKKH